MKTIQLYVDGKLICEKQVKFHARNDIIRAANGLKAEYWHLTNRRPWEVVEVLQSKMNDPHFKEREDEYTSHFDYLTKQTA